MGSPTARRTLLIGLAVLLAAGVGCRCSTQTPTEPGEPTTPSALDPCQAIEAAPFLSLPRRLAGNQLDPSGVVAVGPYLWIVNDREGREGAPPEGNGLVRVELATGTVEHVPVPGLDGQSRKFEGLAWDGVELYVTGNVGSRERNTILYSVPVDAGTGQITGDARFYDLAGGIGEATGLGHEPWDHGIKVEALAALGPRDLVLALRANGDGVAHNAYRATLPSREDESDRISLTPVPSLHDLDLGRSTAEGQDVPRHFSGLSDPVGDPRLVAGVASAELSREGTDLFLANGLLGFWPDTGEADLWCAFDAGNKAEGIAFAPAATGPDGRVRGTLTIVYDNDKEAAGAYKVVPDVVLPARPANTTTSPSAARTSP